MNFVRNIQNDRGETVWRRLWHRLLNWIVSGPLPQPYDIQIQLLHHSLTKKTTLIVVVLAMAMLASVAVVITEQAWAYAWLFAEIGLGVIRISIQVAFERAAANGEARNGYNAIAAGLVWGLVLSAATYLCVASGEWILILLAGICLAGLVGGISSRNAGTPHYAIVLMCVVSVPYTIATFVSPLPHLYMIGILIPFYLIGIVLVLLENYRVLLGLYRAERENRWLAHHDLLTGLPNRSMKRRRFDDLLREQHSLPSTDRPAFTVLCLDLDGFKSINDRFGHAAGDALLVAVARRLRESIREVDFLCRIGGDEFVILLPAIAPDEVETAAQRIIERISEPFDLGLETPLQVGISIGSASAPQDGTSADELLRSADRAMYRAKRQGKGLFVAHSEAANELVELAPAADADARMAARFTDRRDQESPRFSLPFRSKSV